MTYYVSILTLLCLFFFNSVFAQKKGEVELKTATIFEVAKNIDWAEELDTKKFRIGILDKDSSFFRQVKKLAIKTKIHNKTVLVSLFRNIDDIRLSEVLFVPSNSYAYDLLSSKIPLGFTLLITENAPFEKTMMNLMSFQDSVFVLLNVKMLRLKGYTINKNFLSKSIYNMSRCCELLQAFEQRQKKLKDSLLLKNEQINQLKASRNNLLTRVNYFDKRIVFLKDSIEKQQNDKIRQDKQLEELNNQILAKRRVVNEMNAVLESYILGVDTQEKLINEQQTAISEQQKKLKNQQILFEQQQKRINQQERILKDKQAKIEKQKITLFFYSIVFMVIIVIIFLIYGSYKVKKRANKQLEEKNNAIELQKQQIELARQEAEKANQAKSIFLANMSHEIRTPMNSILGFSELLLGLIHDSQQKNYLSAIRTGGKNLLALINDILDISKIESGKMELQSSTVDLSGILNELQQIFSLKVQEKDLDFSIQISPNFPASLWLDEVRIRQVLLNLIGNAVKFTEYGFVKIELQTQNQTPLHTDIILKISDSGIGINSNSLYEIFEPFKQQQGQSNKKYGGTGLGLSITKRLVEMMNGTIKVHSEPKKGSQFEVVLKEVSVINTQFNNITSEIDWNTVRFAHLVILIVDANAENRALLKAYLNSNTSDTQITSASTAKDGLNLAIMHHPDLILMDMRISEVDGIDLLKEIRQHTQLQEQKTIIIALTASTMKQDISQIAQKQFDGVLLRPVSKVDLLKEMGRLLPYVAPKKDLDSTTFAPINMPKITYNELIKLLENEMNTKWKRVYQGSRFNDCRDFGYEIRTIGMTYNVEPLFTFGLNIYEYAQCFDVENLTHSMAYYPKLVNDLKQQIVTDN